MSFRIRSFVSAVIMLGTLLTLLYPLASLAEVIPYEDWQDGVVHGSRWRAGEGFGGQEAVLEVTPDKQLLMRYRRQGSTASNTGSTQSDQFLFNVDSPSIDGLEAVFTVSDLSMTVCAANNSGGTTSARPARILIEKFNDGTTTTPGDRTGDYQAFVEAFRDGSSANPAHVLNVRGVIIRCSNATCSTSTTVVAKTLATTVSIGQPFTLRIRWDQPNHRFVFGLDNSDSDVLPYTASDVNPANNLFVDIDVFHRTANCILGAVAIDSTTLVGAVSIIVPDPIFSDVPRSHPFFAWIEALFEAGITGGCSTSPPLYCPDDGVTRAQMAVFLVRGIHGAGFQPPPATGTVFTDIPANHPLGKWIEQLARDGITGGCSTSPPAYCPDAVVTRAQMAVFLLRSEHGAGYNPPAATGTVFNDIPIDQFFAKWIEQLAREGITGGCSTSPPLYCPDADVTRGQMAVFLVRAFNLPL